MENEDTNTNSSYATCNSDLSLNTIHTANSTLTRVPVDTDISFNSDTTTPRVPLNQSHRQSSLLDETTASIKKTLFGSNVVEGEVSPSKRIAREAALNPSQVGISAQRKIGPYN